MNFGLIFSYPKIGLLVASSWAQVTDHAAKFSSMLLPKVTMIPSPPLKYLKKELLNFRSLTHVMLFSSTNGSKEKTEGCFTL